MFMIIYKDEISLSILTIYSLGHMSSMVGLSYIERTNYSWESASPKINWAIKNIDHDWCS